MVDHVFDMVAEVPGGNVNGMQDTVGLLGHQLCVTTFIVARVIAEAAVESQVAGRVDLVGKNGDQTGINAAGDIGSDGHITA